MPSTITCSGISASLAWRVGPSPPMPLTFSYLMVPQSARQSRNSSKPIVSISAPASPWHVTKAPLQSSHERFEWTLGRKRPVMLGVGVTFLSSATTRSLISSQKTSIPSVEPAPSSSPPALPNWSAVPVIVVASRAHTLKLGLERLLARRLTRATSGSFSMIFFILASALRRPLARMFFSST